MTNQLITVAAYVAAFTTVFIERVLQPAALLLLAYIDQLLAPETPQLALAPASNAVVVTPVETAVKPVKPRAARRRRATKAVAVEA